MKVKSQGKLKQKFLKMKKKVIVFLSILAVTSYPKFIDLKKA